MSAVLAFTLDDRGVFLVDDDPLGAAEFFQGDVLELHAEVFAEETAAREDSEVFQHGLAAITEARGLDGADLDGATELVHDESRERFAFDFFGDDEQRTARLRDLFQQGQHVLEVRDFLLVDQDVGVLQNGFEVFRVRDEVRRQVALVELHAFDDVERGLDALGFLDSDGSVFADLVQRVSDDLADGGVPVGGDGRDLLDLFLVLHLFGDAGEFFRDGRQRPFRCRAADRSGSHRR